MARVPLFESDYETLMAKLRLSSITEDSDTASIIDEAIGRVRRGLFDQLGSSLVATILETDLEEEFLTQEEIIRASAAQAEVLWVKYLLLKDLPVLFRDASGQTLDEWNKEALVRETPPNKQLLDSIWKELQDLLGNIQSGSPQPAYRFETIENPDPVYPLSRQANKTCYE